jgi:hypothetical protein
MGGIGSIVEWRWHLMRIELERIWSLLTSTSDHVTKNLAAKMHASYNG